MNTEQETTRSIVAHFIEAFIEGGGLDAFHDTMAPGLVNRTPQPGRPADTAGAAYFFTEYDRVVTRSPYRSIHGCAFRGLAPTGRTVEFDVIDTVRLEDGRSVGYGAVAEMAGLRTRLEGK